MHFFAAINYFICVIVKYMQDTALHLVNLYQKLNIGQIMSHSGVYGTFSKFMQDFINIIPPTSNIYLDSNKKIALH